MNARDYRVIRAIGRAIGISGVIWVCTWVVLEIFYG